MASITNTLMNVLKKSSSFSIVDTNGNILAPELKIKQVMVNEHAESAKQPLNLNPSALQQKTSTTTQSAKNNTEVITVTSSKTSHDHDILCAKIMDPNSLTIDCFAPTLTTCTMLLKCFNNITDTYTVTSKDVQICNMTLTDLQFRIREDTLNAYLCTIIFQEVFSPDKTYSPLKDGDQDSVGLTVTPHSIKDKVENMAKKIYNDVI